MGIERIRALVCDVDGVLTDGSILLGEDGAETKRFNSHDGAGIHLWVECGYQVALLTGRKSGAARQRAKELGIQHVREGARDKMPVYEELLAAMGATDAEVCCMGDDLPDVPVMRRAGYSAAPADAREEVRAAASYVTHARGGRGAVREVIERILKAQGKWAGILERFQA